MWKVLLQGTVIAVVCHMTRHNVYIALMQQFYITTTDDRVLINNASVECKKLNTENSGKAGKNMTLTIC